MSSQRNIARHAPQSTDVVDVKTLGFDQLRVLLESIGQPAYRARQVFRWIHRNGAQSFDEMSSLPLPLRSGLADVASLPLVERRHTEVSSDGTVKILYRLPSARMFETVLIPDYGADGEVTRATVCVSSQVGCAMGCSFCATGLMGFRENVSAGHIVDQVRNVDEISRTRYGKGVTNVVFMGMGEPLLNYDQVMLATRILSHRDGLGLSAKRITVSTVGLARRIRNLAEDNAPFNLAISLHAPTDEKRSSIMPVNRSASTDLDALRDAIVFYHRETGKRVTYEYCMFDGFNDSVDDAKRLAGVVRWAPSKVNLIMYNRVDGTGFDPTPERRLNAFIQELVRHRVRVTVRRSRGQDINAACGQLAVETLAVDDLPDSTAADGKITMVQN